MPCIRPGMRRPPRGFESIQETLDEIDAEMKEAVQAPSLGVLPTSTSVRGPAAKLRRVGKEEVGEAGTSSHGGEEEAGPASTSPPPEQEVPPLWRIAQLNKKRTRFVFDAFFREKRITKEVFDYCCETQLIDVGLVKRWRAPGYEKLCCVACGMPGAASAAAQRTTKIALRDKAGKKRKRDDHGAEAEEGGKAASVCVCRVPASQRLYSHFGACVVCGCTGCSSSS